jgi:hypothetical protein
MVLLGPVKMSLLLLEINISSFGRLLVEMFKEKWDNREESLRVNLLHVMHLVLVYLEEVKAISLFGKEDLLIKVYLLIQVAKCNALYLIRIKHYYTVEE